MTLKRIQLTQKDKDNLELVSGQKILLKNTFTASSRAIATLQRQAVANALEYLHRKRLGQKVSIYEENNLYQALHELEKALNIPNFPHRIECFDISHLQGTLVYGSMIVSIDGRLSKKLYRLFRTKEQNNDYENLQEVIRRRLTRAIEHGPQSTWKLPELLVIDGGKGQLSAVMKVIDEFRSELYTPVQVCALAKQEELVFIPEKTDPIRFEGVTLFLLQRLRDEAHRFGIHNNRKAKNKMARATELSHIKGIGEKTSKKLLVEFGSIKNLIDQLWNNYPYVEEFAGKSVTQKLAHYFGIRR